MNDTSVLIKERPLPISTALIKPTMDDIKTQTRRLKNLKEINANPDDWILYASNCCNSKGENIGIFLNGKTMECREIKCPYGHIGDRLWVKETWAGQDFAVCTPEAVPCYQDKKGVWHPVIHKAGTENYAWGMSGEPKWRPSMFMPRWASRITLEITNIRIERVQDITKNNSMNQVKAEAVDFMPPYQIGVFGYNAFATFMMYWDSLNAKRGYSWDINPWVWVIEFKRIAP